MPTDIVTETFRNALARATKVALDYRAAEITPEIIFVAIMADTKARTSTILKGFGITADWYQSANLPQRRNGAVVSAPSFSEHAMRLINATVALAHEQGHQQASTQHFLVALLQDPPDGFNDSVTNDNSTPERILATFFTHRDEP